MKGPKSGVVKASFRECSLEDRATFHDFNCMLLISVGQPYHEEEKFAATIDLVNAKFKACTIMVCDTLQRHNIEVQENCTPEQAHQLSLDKGEQWIIRNKPIYERLTIPYQVVRWDKWLKHHDFEKRHFIIRLLYANDENFKQAIDHSIDEYIERYEKRSRDHMDYKGIFDHCLKYLKEECAAMILWIEEEYAFEVYPNIRNEAMTETYKKLIQPIYPHLLKPVALRFKRYAKPSAVLLHHKNKSKSKVKIIET